MVTTGLSSSNSPDHLKNLVSYDSTSLSLNLDDYEGKTVLILGIV